MCAHNRISNAFVAAVALATAIRAVVASAEGVEVLEVAVVVVVADDGRMVVVVGR